MESLMRDLHLYNMQTIKTKKGREGVIVKPFQKLTAELLSFYTEESKKEARNIKLLLKTSPELFKSDNELSMWNSIYHELDNLGISKDLSRMYMYEGYTLTLYYYLLAKGGVENNASMVAVAYAVEIALETACCVLNGDVTGLKNLVDASYFGGKSVASAHLQDDFRAGESRTSEASKKRIEQRKQRENFAIEKAKELKKDNPKMFKADISPRICGEVGRSASTVLGYLKGVDLTQP